MKRLTQILPVFLAAALQVMPLLRNIITSPAASSSFAFILRWGIGSTAALGAFDACSGASAVYFTTPTNFTGTVGLFFTNNIAITNNGGDPGAYFILTNKLGTTSLPLFGGSSTTSCLPAGLTFKCYDLNNGSSPKPIYGAIYGTPATPVTNYFVHLLAGFSGQVPAETNIYITILPAGSGVSPPVITNQPTDLTTVAGGTASFSVTAGGTAPLVYQWKFNTNTTLPNATNATLSLTNVRASQAGAYSVTVTNASGVTNSFQAVLVVTNPLPPVIDAPARNSGLFQFTFVPVIGLTNSVETNSMVSGGTWITMTNVPPPVNASPVTVTDPFGSSNRFYRVTVVP